jgi:spore coat polysaccharide biosynthesis protein SpsF
MKRVAIVQARMTSSRLPGKILADLCGRPMLAQQLRRMKRMEEIDDIVIATTVNAADDSVVDLARCEEVRWFRGDEHNVLSRYCNAAREAHADLVLRITADCPLLDPGESDRVSRALTDEPTLWDYASNVMERTYPRGLDTEALFIDVLTRVERMASSPSALEHVTWLVNHEPRLFARKSVVHAENNAHLRWTVDTPEDLAAVRSIYGALGLGEAYCPYSQVLAHVKRHAELSAINAHVEQKQV